MAEGAIRQRSFASAASSESTFRTAAPTARLKVPSPRLESGLGVRLTGRRRDHGPLVEAYCSPAG